MIHKNNLEKSLKIIFAGTSDFSANYLNLLLLSHHRILAVLTQPDRPNTRGKKIIQSPVKFLSENYKIQTFQPNTFHTIHILKFMMIKINFIIVIAYGIIIPKYILNIFPKKYLNIHTSLLPKWKGAAPIQWSILNGDYKTGITIIQMDENMDTGKILHKISCPTSIRETTISLTKKLYNISSQKILTIINNIQNKKYQFKQQNPKATTYAIKIKKKMASLNFFMNAKHIDRMIRALNPKPGTYIKIKNNIIKIFKVTILKSIKKYHIGEIIKINNHGIQIQTIKNIINIQKIQLPGKKIIKISEFINSHQKIFSKGNILNNK
ncbi:Methionyl-tRNA formyltransferase [Buchnera aphidicola (Phyllaphis fagi)]|uniref:methionyl-tRNA formyltransferase n=1 Tax=Buchnera aphidicola TaxID=9 RepID=UPI003464C12A